MKIALLCIAFFAAALSAQATVSVDRVDTPVVGAFQATLGGKVSATGENSHYFLEYGTTTSYGKSTTPQAMPLNESPTDSMPIDTMTGLLPNTTYHCRIKITGDTSHTSAVSDDRMFITSAAVSVVQTSAPQLDHTTVASALLKVGSNSTLAITPNAGSSPFTYQWKLNGKSFGAASKSSNVGLSPVTAAHGGTWTCTVSNPVPSNATSPGVAITVADVTKFPVSGKTALEGGTITATVTLTPANATATYLWHTQSNATGLPNGIGTVTGQGSNKLTIANVNASTQTHYLCDVTLGGQPVTLDPGSVTVGLKPVITSISAQTFRVGEDVGSISVDTGDATSATITGLPAGLKYSFANREITGSPTVATPIDDPAAVIITAKNANGSSTFAFPFTVTPLPAGIVGSWVGVLDRGGDTNALGGKVTINVTATGAVTGSVTNGAVTFPITSSVTSSSGSTAVNLDIINAILTKNVHLVLDTHVLTGTVGNSNVTGRRWVLDPADGTDRLAGPFNCKFSPDAAGLAASNFPHGHSVAVLTITDKRAVTAAFHLADNTVVTASSNLCNNGDIPLFVPLYGSTGSFLGTAKLNDRDITGTFSWNKLSTTANVAYKPGFGARDVTCTGKRYVKPNAAFSQYYAELPNGQGIMTIDDGLISSPVLNSFNVSLAGAIAFDIANPSITLSLSISTGVESGTIKISGTDIFTSKSVTRTAPYYTLAIPGTGKAFGYYLSEVIQSQGASNRFRSGIVELGP